ncbi:hypothetical protein F5141DRAFT_1237461 [Pisolithus sp. B1]|nr:hypothetical protein F5141DRAFT_1237461 [Pisolithus sp. B1]
MIVVQEVIEELRWYYRDGDEETRGKPITAPVQRLIGLTVLCTAAIPRLRLGKRTPFQLAGPVVLDISSLVPFTTQDATKHEGRLLIREIAGLVRALQPWASASASEDDLGQMKKLLRDLLDATVVAPSKKVGKTGNGSWWKSKYSDVLAILGTLPELPDPMSTSGLIYLAHAEPAVPLPLAKLTQLHPLLVGLFADERCHGRNPLPFAQAVVATNVLSALASTHLDPFMRHLNLRLLSMVLSKVHQTVRLNVLLRLTTDEELPQMRSAAVGLLKEATLNALSSPDYSTEANPLCITDIATHTKEDLERSLELLRIIDCLSFYYVLLLRDRKNATGIRDPDNVASVERSFLRPLRRFLDQCITMQGEPLMTVLSLQANLERVDAAVTTVKGTAKILHLTPPPLSRGIEGRNTTLERFDMAQPHFGGFREQKLGHCACLRDNTFLPPSSPFRQ